METPSITAPQYAALVVAFINAAGGALLAFLLDLSDGQRVALLGLFLAFGALVSGSIMLADAAIRRKRAEHAGAIAAAQASLNNKPAAAPRKPRAARKR